MELLRTFFAEIRKSDSQGSKDELIPFGLEVYRVANIFLLVCKVPVFLFQFRLTIKITKMCIFVKRYLYSQKLCFAQLRLVILKLVVIRLPDDGSEY